MRTTRLAAIAAATALALSACGSDDGGSGDDSGPIQLGFINIFSGPASAIGKSAKEGVDLAVAEINADGGVDGREIEVIQEDAGSTPPTAVTGVKRLISEEPDLVIGTPLTAQALAIGPILKQAEMPTLIYAGAINAIEDGRPWLFRFIPNARTEAGNAVTYAVEDQAFTKVGIIYESTDFGKGGADAITAALEEAGVTPVASEAIDVDATSADAQVSKMKSGGAEAVFVWASGTPSTLAIKAANALDLGAELITSGAAANANVLGTLSNDEISAMRASLVSTVTDAEDPEVAAFNEAYEAEYGYLPDQNAAAYYDAVYLAAEALKSAGTGDKEALRDAIGSISDYTGVSNVYSFDEDGECCTLGTVVRFDDDKRPEVVAKLDAE